MSLFSRISNAPSAINTQAANTFGSTGGAATSGFGGTSVFGQSTSQAPASAGLLGQTSSTAPSGGLFGSSAANTSTPAAGSLFGTTAANANATTTTTASSLFGQTTNTTTPAPSSSGLFGSTPATTQSATTGGGLFGSTPATSQPTSGGNLFGSTAASTSQSAIGGLFGSAPATTTSQPAVGSLFGSTVVPSQLASTGAPFGSSTTRGGGGLFGNQQNAQQQQPKTLFGNTSTQPATGASLFNSSTTTQQSQQPSQQQQAVEMNFSNMRGTTRYEELHGDIKNKLDEFDKKIQEAINISQELNARSVGQKENMESVHSDVELVSRKCVNTNAFLNNDGTSVGHLHNLSNQLVNTASLSTRTIDILRLPISQRSHYISSHHTANAEYSLIPYFEEKTGEIEGKTTNFLGRLTEVERTLEGLEREVGQAESVGGENRSREVVKAERLVFSGMVAVAGRVAGINDNLKGLTDRPRV